MSSNNYRFRSINLTSTAVTNLSNVLGSSVTDALNNLNALIPSSFIVYVSQLSDFPDPVAGVITLAIGTAYVIVANVNISPNRIVAPDNAAIFGIGAGLCSLITTIASPLITANKTLTIRDLGLVNPAGGCILMQGAGPADVTCNMRGDDLILIGAGNIIELDNCEGAVIIRSTWTGGGVGSNGVRITNTIRGFVAELCGFRQNGLGSTFLSSPAASSVLGRLVLTLCTIDLTNGCNGTNVDAASVLTNGLNIVQSAFTDPTVPGVGTAAIGVTSNSPDAVFQGNLFLLNTAPRGIQNISGNGVATINPGVNDWVKVAGVTSSVEFQQFDTITTSNRIQYVGITPIRIEVLSISTFVTLAFTFLEVGFAINDVIQLDFTSIVHTDALLLTVENVSVQGIFTLNSGDYVELWARNLSDGQDFIGLNWILNVMQIGA